MRSSGAVVESLKGFRDWKKLLERGQQEALKGMDYAGEGVDVVRELGLTVVINQKGPIALCGPQEATI